jgi:hypothetical protein
MIGFGQGTPKVRPGLCFRGKNQGLIASDTSHVYQIYQALGAGAGFRFFNDSPILDLSTESHFHAKS